MIEHPPPALSHPVEESTLNRGALLAATLLIAVFVVLAWGAARDTASAENAPTVAGSVAESASLHKVATPPAAIRQVAAVTAPSGAAVKSTGAPGAATWHRSQAVAAIPGPRWAPASQASSVMTSPVAGPLAAPLVAEGAIGLVASPTRVFASAAVRAINQCNGSDNVGGLAVTCSVTVVNNLNFTTGRVSSVVTVQECHGAARAALPCTTTITPSNQLTTTVTQCNGSGSGGGGTVTCAVHIVNNITGAATATGATVNQCNGSGTGGGTQPTLLCDPTGNTTNATITECNGSGNGGGGTIRVQCSVLPSTTTSALRVTVNQCNGSGNGGGAVVICTVSIANLITPARGSSGGGTTGGGTTGGGTGNGAGTGSGAGTGNGNGRTGNGNGRTGNGIRLDTVNTPSSGLTSTVTGGLPSTPLAFTGAPTVSMTLLALLAIALGGLLVSLSAWATMRSRRQAAF